MMIKYKILSSTYQTLFIILFQLISWLCFELYCAFLLQGNARDKVGMVKLLFNK